MFSSPYKAPRDGISTNEALRKAFLITKPSRTKALKESKNKTKSTTLRELFKRPSSTPYPKNYRKITTKFSQQTFTLKPRRKITENEKSDDDNNNSQAKTRIGDSITNPIEIFSQIPQTDEIENDFDQMTPSQQVQGTHEVDDQDEDQDDDQDEELEDPHFEKESQESQEEDTQIRQFTQVENNHEKGQSLLQRYRIYEMVDDLISKETKDPCLKDNSIYIHIRDTILNVLIHDYDPMSFCQEAMIDTFHGNLQKITSVNQTQ